MFRHSVASTFAALTSVAFSGLLLIAATPSPARAAEIKLLGPASFRVLFPKLLPQFEKSSGHKVTAAYAPLGVITERVINGEAVDVAIVSGKQNEELQKQGKLLAGSRVEIAQVGFTVFIKKGAAKPDLSSADALKRALLAAKSIAVGDPARGGGASLYTIGLLKRLGISEEVKAKSRLEPSGTEIAEAVAKGETDLGIGVASDLSLVAGIESVVLPAEVQNYSGARDRDRPPLPHASSYPIYLSNSGVRRRDRQKTRSGLSSRNDANTAVNLIACRPGLWLIPRCLSSSCCPQL
jgi:molybdate transport system substrate-binding protein